MSKDVRLRRAGEKTPIEVAGVDYLCGRLRIEPA